MPKKVEYKVGPGRTITRDGEPFIYVAGDGQYKPYEVDRVAHRIAHLLNEHGFVCEPALGVVKKTATVGASEMQVEAVKKQPCPSCGRSMGEHKTKEEDGEVKRYVVRKRVAWDVVDRGSGFDDLHSRHETQKAAHDMAIEMNALAEETRCDCSDSSCTRNMAGGTFQPKEG